MFSWPRRCFRHAISRRKYIFDCCYQVTRTITEFAFSYIAEIFAFALAFHLLLPDSRAFGQLGDGILKVLTMLLGEFDMVDTILEDPASDWLTKIIFSLFLLLMSVVLMNLVIGLAISDIGSLRKEARALSLRYTTSFLRIIGFESKVLGRVPLLGRLVNTVVCSEKIHNFQDKVRVCGLYYDTI